ncbi:MAG: biopolymer transporter ExbD [Deltaproteobacteria bacterium]|nr:biopolymer transporter ExbD [Deltaproteobacteria bacterium]
MAYPLKKSKRFDARPVMNVTPLVDVVLVLLIIFMVVIPALEDSLNIEVPGISNVDDYEKSKVEPFVLSLTKDGEFFLDETAVPPERLQQALAQAVRRAPGRRLVLRADRKVLYSEVRKSYQVAQKVGFPGVSLRVNRRKSENDSTPGASRASDAVRPVAQLIR